MSTWQPPGGRKTPNMSNWQRAVGMTPPRRDRRLRIPIVVGVVVGLLPVLGIGYLLLVYNNIAFLDGPSRSKVAHTAQDMVSTTMASFTPLVTLGQGTPYFGSCGHRDGVGQLQYTGGVEVPISGVAPADHKRVADQLTAASYKLTAQHKGTWGVSVLWTSPTGMTGTIDASVECTDIAN